MWWYILAGVTGGLLGGMGMGGGTLLIPILSVFLDVEQKMAQAINLISFVPMAVVTVIIHARNKLIDVKNMLYVSLPAIFSAIGGAVLARYVSADFLRKAFGVFLILLGVIFTISTIVRWVKSRAENKILTRVNVKKAEDGK